MRGLLAAVLLVSGCALFDDPPDRSCQEHRDCFQAQGERCNEETKTCEVPPDAAALETDEPEPVESTADEAVSE